MDGAVFISYSRDDKTRIQGLVDYLSEKGIPVWWDDNLQGGQVFRNIIPNALDKASCVIVAWSTSSVNKDWVRAEAEEGRKRGVLLPVLLDNNIRLPLPFGEYHCYDFTQPNFLQQKDIKKLLKILTAVTKHGRPLSAYEQAIDDNNWVLREAMGATDEVRELVQKLGSLSEIMTLDARSVTDIKLALKEVEKTYTVVNNLIAKFLLAITAANKIPLKPFIEMGRGSLDQLIKKGHGHCTLILTHYTKAKGLRESIQQQLDAQQLNDLDGIFMRLGNADNDLFQEMTDIGRVLTNESKLILNLLLTEQHAVVRKRIVDDHAVLEPIEQKMSNAYAELQAISQKIGAAI